MLSLKSKSERPKNFFPVFAGVLFLDQLLKCVFVRCGLYRKNYAALFGLKAEPLLSLLALVAFFLFVLLYLKKRKDRARLCLPLALILAGVAGNTIDRWRYGFVIDYIRLPDIFIFNLADLAILLGAVFFIWRIIKE